MQPAFHLVQKRRELWAKLAVLWPLVSGSFPVRADLLGQKSVIGRSKCETGRIKGRAVVLPGKQETG